MSARREANVAMLARLYRLLADRPEYLRHDTAERYDRTDRAAAPNLGEVEAELVGRSEEIDRFCGYAVGVLRRGGTGTAGLIDALGVLDPDRLAAVALALPDDRRATLVRSDPVWARAVADLDAGLLAQVEEVADGINALTHKLDSGYRTTAGDVADDVRRVQEGIRRRAAGLPHDLTPEEIAAFSTGPDPQRPPLGVVP